MLSTQLEFTPAPPHASPRHASAPNLTRPTHVFVGKDKAYAPRLLTAATSWLRTWRHLGQIVWASGPGTYAARPLAAATSWLMCARLRRRAGDLWRWGVTVLLKRMKRL